MKKFNNKMTGRTMLTSGRNCLLLGVNSERYWRQKLQRSIRGRPESDRGSIVLMGKLVDQAEFMGGIKCSQGDQA